MVTARRKQSSESIEIEAETQKYVLGANEQLLFEESLLFDVLISQKLVCHISALTKQTGGASATYRVRIGGTIGVADGVEVVALTTTRANYSPSGDHAVGLQFTNPFGLQLVKITAAASLLAETARIKGFSIIFVGL